MQEEEHAPAEASRPGADAPPDAPGAAGADHGADPARAPSGAAGAGNGAPRAPEPPGPAADPSAQAGGGALDASPEPAGAAPSRPRRNLYGRRHGKALKPAQRGYLAEDLGRLSVPAGAGPLDPAALAGPGRPLWVEIGFGAGEHMVHQAALHPEVLIIGCEIFLNGVAMALGRIRRAGVANIRIHAGDARDLLDRLPEGSVARAFLLYPDPWPKRRHRRRRFIEPENLAPLVRALAPGAELRLASDVPDYIAHAREVLPPQGFALLTPEGAEATPWPDWIRTRYEAKAIREGRRPAYLTFRREPSGGAGAAAAEPGGAAGPPPA